MKVKDYVTLEMKNNSFAALATLLSFLKNDHLGSLRDLQVRIDTMIRSKTKDVDPILEFKIGLHKFLSLQILKLRGEDLLPEQQADLASQALQNLFEGNSGWWYENSFLADYAGYVNPSHTLRELFRKLLLEVACTTENHEHPLNCLTEREKEVLVLLNGLKEVKSVKIDEVGEKLNLSRDRVRQIMHKGLHRVFLRAEKMGLQKPNFI